MKPNTTFQHMQHDIPHEQAANKSEARKLMPVWAKDIVETATGFSGFENADDWGTRFRNHHFPEARV